MSRGLSLPSLALLLLLGLLACREEESAVSSRADAAPSFVGPGYGGVETCRECHAERVDSYRRTAHFRTLRRPDPGEFATRSDRIGSRLETRDPALRHEFEVADDRVFASGVIDLGGRELRRRRAVDFIMGSGRIFEGYLSFEEDRLVQLPVGYFRAADSWSNCPGYPDGETAPEREILPRCLDCHGTWAETRGGARYDPASIMPGLSCERCHGPGREHVEFHRAHPEAEEGRHVVKPAELPRERRLDLCAQCHAEPGELVGRPFEYRPGEPLAAHVRQEGGHGSDVFVHTANQIQRLQSSPCFQASAELDCISCHRTHAPEDERLIRRSLAVCAGCHQPEHCRARDGLPEDLRGDCLDCHMPERQVTDTVINTRTEDFLDFFRMTEHRIGVDHDAALRALARHRARAGQDDAREIAALVARLEERAAEKERAHRFVEAMALRREAGRIDPAAAPSPDDLARLAARERRRGEALGMLDEARRFLRGDDRPAAQARLEAALRLDPGQPEATVLLAEVRRASRDLEGAEELLHAALTARPDFADAAVALADLQLERGRAAAAIALLEPLVRAQPRLARAWFLLARARAFAGDLEGALAALDRHGAIVPDDELGPLNRAALLVELDRAPEALAIVERIGAGAAPETRAGQARLLERLGREARAAVVWGEVLQEPATADRARAALAWLALDAGEEARAAELLGPLRGRRDDAEILAAQARLARVGNRGREAEVLLREALAARGARERVLLESFRLVAGSRIHDADAIARQAEELLASPLGADPRVLLEVAEVRAGDDPAAARALLDRALARSETALVPGLRERILSSRARLDGDRRPR